MTIDDPHRILIHRAKIEAFEKNAYTPPLTIDIEPTWFCNHKCIWCAYASDHKRTSLNIETFVDIVSYAKRQKVPWILISGGGEPCAHKDIKSMFNILESQLQNYTLNTNGFNLNRLAENIGKCCKYLRISLDASNMELHQKLHRCSSDHFNNALEGARKLKKKFGADQRIGFSMVVIDENIDDIEEFIELGNLEQVDEILIKSDINKDSSFVDEVNSRIERVCKNKRSRVANRKNSVIHGHKSPSCYASRIKMVVDGAGDVSLCCLLRGKQYNIGNVNSEKLEDIWYNEKHKKLLTEINPASCPTCRFTVANDIYHNIYKNNAFNELI